MARQVLSAGTPVAFNLQDFRNSAYEKINAMFAELYGKVSWGNGVPGASAGPKGTMYLRQDGGAGTTLYIREAAGAPVAATNTLTLTGLPIANETITIDNTTYTFVATPNAAYEVQIGADASATIDNLIAAMQAGAGAGTVYGTGTAAHPTVTVAAGAGDTMTLTANTPGATGSLIETSEILTEGNFTYDNMYGGVDDDGTGWVAK
jgi:hypothetical protein